MKGEKGRQEWGAVLAIASIALALAGALGWGVWRQVYRLRELRAAEMELIPLVSHAQARNEELSRGLRHASSPEYLEEWARIHGGMTLPDETLLVVPLPDEPAGPTPSALPTQTASSSQPAEGSAFWQRLWLLLFGSD